MAGTYKAWSSLLTCCPQPEPRSPGRASAGWPGSRDTPSNEIVNIKIQQTKTSRQVKLLLFSAKIN